MKDLLTVAEAAAVMGISERRLRAMITAGQVPAQRPHARFYLIEGSVARNYKRRAGGRPRKRRPKEEEPRAPLEQQQDLA